MNKKSLILSITLILIVFVSASVVSASNETSNISNIDTTTASEITIKTTDNNDEIQTKINTLKDGDILNFEKGDYQNVSLYVNKSITINGNGATLYGYDKLSDTTINPIIQNKTSEGGYGITNLATLYILQTDGLILKDINIVSGENSGTEKGADARYSNCVIYNYKSNNTLITNTIIDGCSWGIWLQNCADTIVENNNVKNQKITGILSFQSPRTIIRNNTLTKAKNHAIDVRHQAGPNAKVLNNTVIGSKEGIYLLHSKGHTVTGNTILNCTLSSITCCGASNINIEDNRLYNSRIGVLLGGGAPVGGTYTPYSNITIGENDWKLDTLPMPPSFVFYVAEAKSNYASQDAMMGTHSDSSVSDITYVPYSGIETPEKAVVDYEKILKPEGKIINITAGMNNGQIQSAIDGMNDGDTLIFETNAIFENICIYIDKNIKIIGNNATLKGLSTLDLDAVPAKITKQTNESGYAITYRAVLYCVNNTGAVISNLNIIANYPAYDLQKPNGPAYTTAGIYAENSRNLTVTGCSVQGASWGIFVGYQQRGCPNSIITNNNVSDQYTTGIICFGSKKSLIINNTVTNAKNHGIDVRFPAGFGVTVFNNTISGAKEGIYLLHSYGHKVYKNTVLNSKISSITCYGSYNETIFNNTLSGSRTAILLGGGYHDVTIGENLYKPDKLPFPPTFENFLVKSEDKYQSAEKVMRTYSDKESVSLKVQDITVTGRFGELTVRLTDQNDAAITQKSVVVSINKSNYTEKTDENGTAKIAFDLPAGTYVADISFTGNDNYANAKSNVTITIDKLDALLTASAKKVYLKTISAGYKYSVTLKDANDTALANKTITLSFNGKNYTATTNAKGIATFKLKATAAGSKKVKVTFKGDDEYKAVDKTATIKITKEASKLTAKKKTFKVKTKVKRYSISLKSKSGKAISGVKVTIKINKKTYSAKTNLKGKATFKINKLTKKGTFKSAVKFAGNKYYNAATKKVSIIIK